MAMFHDVRLPDHIERGARGGPGFLTTVIGVVSGREQRNQEWQFARAEWDISYGMQNKADYKTIMAFFFARRGRAFGFRFKDWTDYQGTGETIGIGDLAQTDFQLIKTYTDTASSYVRRITRPVSGTVKVYIDDVQKTEGPDYSLSATGLLSFSAPPGTGEVVTSDYEFDVPVRFDTDTLDMSVEWTNAASFPSLDIVELKE